MAIEAGDITLIQNDLQLVPAAIRLSFQTMKVIRQNLFWHSFITASAFPLPQACSTRFSGSC